MIVTSAPSPTAILAAFVPACPPPMIVTLPRLTPGTPASKIPLPPLFSQGIVHQFAQPYDQLLHS